MELKIDGYPITVRAGESLLDLVQRISPLENKLSTDPLVAKIAGEIFTLNYVPLRQKDVQNETESMRKAMQASGGAVRLLRYDDPAGRDAYRRTAQFVLFLALRRLWPTARGKMSCTVGAGLFVTKHLLTRVTNFFIEHLK